MAAKTDEMGRFVFNDTIREDGLLKKSGSKLMYRGEYVFPFGGGQPGIGPIPKGPFTVHIRSSYSVVRY